MMIKIEKVKISIVLFLAIIIFISFTLFSSLAVASIIPATQVIESQGAYFTVNYDNVTIYLDGREATIIKGQEVHFFNETGAPCGIVTLEGISGDAEDETEQSDPDGVLDSSKTGGIKTGKYNATADCDGCKPTIIKVTTTSFKLDLKRGSKSVAGKKLPQGTSFRIEFKNSLDPDDGVSLRVENPSGDILKANPADGTVFDHVNVEHLENLEINTTGWDLGEYKFKILTEEEYARGFSEESSEKTLEIIKSEISIEAEKDKVAELERLKLTVTGAPGRSINISVTRGCEFAKFPARVNDNPSDGATGSFTDELDDVDGENVYSIYFERSGPYTIEVRYPDTGEMDSVDVSVVKKKALLDVPDTCVIGDDLRINGTVNTGNTVDIAIDDTIVKTDVPVDSQGHFSEDLPTPRTPSTSIEGDIEIRVFIDADLEVGDDVSDLKCDGSAVVTLLEGSLSLDKYPTLIARGDTLTISGTALGFDSIDLIAISPKGGGGDGLNPSDSELEGLPPGITYYTESTSGENSRFLFEIDIQDGADEGKYLLFILVPGKDGIYGRMGTPFLLDGIRDRYAGGDLMNLAGKTQDELEAILRDATQGAVGSGDIVKMIEVEVAEGVVRLDPIEDVIIGDDLVVTGSSNREGSNVIVRVYGAMDLGRKLTPVENGRFMAVFETVEAVTGTYTVEVDDRSGHTDTRVVRIIAPTPVKTLTPTPAPPAPTPSATTPEGLKTDVSPQSSISNPSETTEPESKLGNVVPGVPQVSWFVVSIAIILLLLVLTGVLYLIRR